MLGNIYDVEHNSNKDELEEAPKQWGQKTVDKDILYKYQKDQTTPKILLCSIPCVFQW